MAMMVKFGGLVRIKYEIIGHVDVVSNKAVMVVI